MSRPVKFAKSAIREIRQAKQHYGKIRHLLFFRFIREVDDAIVEMIERPLSFPEYLHGTRRVLLRKFPYMVVFQNFEDHFLSSQSPMCIESLVTGSVG